MQNAAPSSPHSSSQSIHTTLRTIAVIGLGYVGLPVALAFGRRFGGVIGFDCDLEKLERLRREEDPTLSASAEQFEAGAVRWSGDQADLRAADFFIIAVPTPIDTERQPDLAALGAACETVGRALTAGDIVVLESTGYPGLTEEFCAPLLEQHSGLVAGRDFHLGYSPERINPGDEEHGLGQVVKVIAAGDAATLEILAEYYGAIVPAGLHRAPSIRVAEAAKVIENIQRDLNIALVNELSMLFDQLDLDTKAVLEAAGTKWNFQAFQPGLVGGHCIGVDPYYLTSKAQSIGFTPQVILAGRRTNDGMAQHVAARMLALLSEAGVEPQGAHVVVLGLTFKPDVGDLRGSHVPRVIAELRAAGLRVSLHDPLACPQEARAEYALEMLSEAELGAADGLLFAVPHARLIPLAKQLIDSGCGLVMDLMWALDPSELPAGTRYWRL
jgi:UDP-N-acetyl-D-galactosamine dehydrogenase